MKKEWGKNFKTFNLEAKNKNGAIHTHRKVRKEKKYEVPSGCPAGIEKTGIQRGLG